MANFSRLEGYSSLFFGTQISAVLKAVPGSSTNVLRRASRILASVEGGRGDQLYHAPAVVTVSFSVVLDESVCTCVLYVYERGCKRECVCCMR